MEHRTLLRTWKAYGQQAMSLGLTPLTDPFVLNVESLSQGFIDCDNISARCMLTIFQLFAVRTEVRASPSYTTSV